MRVKTLSLVFVFAATIVAGRSTQAGTMNLTLENWGPSATTSSGTSVSLYTTPTGNTVQSGQGGVYVWQGGSFQWQINAGSSQSGLDFVDPLATAANHATQLLTFCIEITQDIGWNGTYTYTIAPLSTAPLPGSVGDDPMGTQAANLIKELWAQDFNSIFTASTTAQKDILAGAFQLAIWKLEYDNGSTAGDVSGLPGSANFSTGYLRVDNLTLNNGLPTDPIVAQAQSWINALSLNPTASQMANLVALTSPTAQDQLAQDPVPAPEPASGLIWLVIGSVAGYCKLRRRGVRA